MTIRGVAYRNYEHRPSTKIVPTDAVEFEIRYNNRAANGVDDKQREELALDGVLWERVHYRNP